MGSVNTLDTAEKKFWLQDLYLSDGEEWDSDEGMMGFGQSTLAEKEFPL